MNAPARINTLDALAARSHFGAIVSIAIGMIGKFVIVLIDGAGKLDIRHVANDANAIDNLMAVAEEGVASGRNVYFAPALFRLDLPAGKKGSEEDVETVLALVADFDDTRATEWPSRMPVSPHLAVETSAGRYQCTVLFDKPLAPQDAKRLAVGLHRAAGCDHCTDDVSHIWRVAGTFNHPSEHKIRRGRSPDAQPCRLIQWPEDWYSPIASDALRAAILTAKSDAFERVTQWSNTPFDWEQRLKPDLPADEINETTAWKTLSADRGKRSEAAFKFFTHARRRNLSPEELFDLICERYTVTPVIERYFERDDWEDALRRDIQRAFEKKLVERDTASIFRIENLSLDSETEKPAFPSRREIKIRGGILPQTVDQAEQSLIEQQVGLFERGGRIVQPAEIKIEVRDRKEVSDLVIAEVGTAGLREHFTNAGSFLKWDGRSNDYKQVDCPREIAETYRDRPARKLRTLTAISNIPTFRPDGTLLDRPGYDPATGLLYDPRNVEFEQVPANPTKDDAQHALAALDELIGKFPFATLEARAVARAALLTSVCRRTLAKAPLFGIDGTGAGSGKSMLVDIASIIGTGRQASPISSGANEEELEKRIVAMMMRGDLVIAADNLDVALESSFLCSALTQESVSPRVLGQSKTLNLPTRHLFMATGNGLSYVGDLNRRALTCLIDPKCEVPSARKFDFDPVERALERRTRYVAAALTVLRAYQAAGRPPQNGNVMGTYGEWCRWVRDALLWLGDADAVRTWQPVNTDDPEREQFAAIVAAWRAVIGLGKAVNVKKAIEAATASAVDQHAAEMDGAPHNAGLDLLDAFKAVAPETARGPSTGIDTTRLGYWLRQHQRRVVDGCRFFPDGLINGARTWRLEDVTRSGGSDA